MVEKNNTRSQFRVIISETENEERILTDFFEESTTTISYLSVNYKPLDYNYYLNHQQAFVRILPVEISKAIGIMLNKVEEKPQKKLSANRARFSTEVSLEVVNHLTHNEKKKKRGCSSSCLIS